MTKNCEDEGEIERLNNAKPSQCETWSGSNDTKSFHLCKLKLGIRLSNKCQYSKVENTGKLLYCKIGKQITCCFKDATCAAWSNIDNSIYTQAKIYLTNRTSVLNHLVANVGYKTCHHLGSYLDASICAKDCDKFRSSKFATECSKGGGLFKCCIRRDKRSCHNCRYCCTLPMCTKPPGRKEDTKFDIKSLELRSQKNKIHASDIFFS